MREGDYGSYSRIVRHAIRLVEALGLTLLGVTDSLPAYYVVAS